MNFILRAPRVLAWLSVALMTVSMTGTVSADANEESGNPLGACCHNYWDGTYVCEMLSDHVCGDYQGYWYGANVNCNNWQVDCDEVGGALGACCADVAPFSCTQETESDCLALPGGYWFGAAVACTDPQVYCEDNGSVVGACCYEDPDLGLICAQELESDCLNLPGGYWYGPGVPCTDDHVDCDLPGGEEGACCYDDPDLGWICTQATQSYCLNLPSGYWYGAGVPCSDPQVECDLPGGEPGACCYDDPDLGWICTQATQSYCLNLPSGYWYGAGVPCSDPQVECDLPGGDKGACCYEDAAGGMVCIEVNAADCETLNGLWYGVGVFCTDPVVDCEDPGDKPGACCYDDPDLGWICTFVLQSDCLNLPNGFWYGAGVPCSDPQVECDLPGGDKGACCYEEADGGMVCIEVNAADCETLNGLWYGVGVFCTDPVVDCEDPGDKPGACCYEDPDLGWICTQATQSYCLNLPSGYWYGAGVPCSDPQVECDLPGGDKGACCYEEADGGMVCIEVNAADCQTLNGLWYGVGVFCTDPVVDCDNEPDKPGACCYDDPDLGWICTFVLQSDCLNLPNGFWYGAGVPCSDPQVECDLPGDTCSIEPGTKCAGRPAYTDPDFAQVFGSERVAVQTAAPNIIGYHVVKVFDLTGINAAPLDSWFALNRYSDPTWTHNELGSVFGLAINGDGDIFVTTTRSWNTDLLGSGGPGAVYRLDHVTGAISVFATLPNLGSCLGSITWDCDYQVFFVTNMEDGLIYRLDAGGNILGSFDPALPWTGAPGPVALGDRPWAVEVHAGRLYYSMWNEHYNTGSPTTANEIRSVSLDPLGKPIGPERTDIILPELGNHDWSCPVADIRFSPRGTMLLAERTMVSFDSVVAHQSRLLEYECQSTAWVPSGNTFSIGEINGNNATGGVDADLERTWVGGDALHIGHPAPYQHIYGFAGMPPMGGTVADSVIIDYQDHMAGQDKTMLGDLVVTEAGEPCPGDINGDGIVSVDDLLVLLSNWGTNGAGDINGDGVVDIEDLLLFISQFGPC